VKPQAAGYSGTPLPRKLGLKPRMRVLAMNPPAHLRALLAGDPAACVEKPLDSRFAGMTNLKVRVSRST
jgi:hypothetical protein